MLQTQSDHPHWQRWGLECFVQSVSPMMCIYYLLSCRDDHITLLCCLSEQRDSHHDTFYASASCVLCTCIQIHDPMMTSSLNGEVNVARENYTVIQVMWC